MYRVTLVIKNKKYDEVNVDSCRVLSMTRVLELKRNECTWYVPLENIEQWKVEVINDNEKHDEPDGAE